MVHIFVTICFLSGGLSGQCLAEHKDPLSNDFASESECHEFLGLVLADGPQWQMSENGTSLIRNKGGVEMRFRCVAEF